MRALQIDLQVDWSSDASLLLCVWGGGGREVFTLLCSAGFLYKYFILCYGKICDPAVLSLSLYLNMSVWVC